MANIGILLLLIGLSLNFSEGRKCWHCENAKGNYDCLMKGSLEECKLNQKYCQNEIRAIAGGMYFEVSKKCKQDNSCGNNKMQNYTGSVPFQCATEKPHSVCRCCCGFDNCNGPNITCMQKQPACPEPDTPVNGYKRCPPKLVVGAVCYYGCRPGYKLEGAKKTECALLGSGIEWTSPPPTCTSEPCEPLEVPDGGSLICTDGWNIGSECSLTCDDGRVLLGWGSTKCSIFSTWSHDLGSCKVVDCFPPRPLDPNFVPPNGECDDGYNYESSCTFTCHPDYNLIGQDTLTCGPPIRTNNKATWSPPRPPKCQKKTCPPQPPSCAETEVGGFCRITCRKCQRLDGNDEVECTRDGWTGPIGSCVDITCNIAPPAPVNGFVVCDSDDYMCDDTCRYACDDGFRLKGGSAVTTCQQSGDWTGPPPECEPSVCKKFDLVGIEERCPPDLSIGATCTLTCEGTNMVLVGTNTVECRMDAGDRNPTWKPGLDQFCRPVLCDDFPGQSPPPEAGSLACGPSGNQVRNDGQGRSGWRVGSECNLRCESGYSVKDSVSRSECTAPFRPQTPAEAILGQWTVDELCCVECLPNTAVDVVVFLDRTASQDLWDTRIAFLENFLDFIVFDYSFNLNVTFIPFAEDVDYANDIDFFTIDDDENPLEFGFLPSQLGSVPAATGQASNSVKAIREALDNIFGFHNSRAPMIFLFTNNAPSDIAGAADEVAELERKAIHLRIFPITGELLADPGANKEAFLSLVQDRNPTYVVDNTEDTEIDELNFNILAGDELITATKAKCNEKAQSLQRCIYAR